MFFGHPQQRNAGVITAWAIRRGGSINKMVSLVNFRPDCREMWCNVELLFESVEKILLVRSEYSYSLHERLTERSRHLDWEAVRTAAQANAA